MARTILVVDDSASLRQFVSIALKGAGYGTVEAGDGKDAFSKLDGRKLHLVISDVNMPNMDGFTFLAAHEANHKIMIVDDYAVVRQVLSSGDRGDRVAVDPLFAMEKMQRHWPDVLELDMEIPRMDGITFLKKLMAERPTPVVICFTLTAAGAQTTLQALAEGAVGGSASRNWGQSTLTPSMKWFRPSRAPPAPTCAAWRPRPAPGCRLTLSCRPPAIP